MIFRRKPRHITKKLLPCRNKSQFFELPLIDSDRSRLNLLQKLNIRNTTKQHPAKLRSPGALLASRDQQNAPAGFHDVGSRRDTLDRLVKRKIERVPGGCRDHRI